MTGDKDSRPDIGQLYQELKKQREVPTGLVILKGLAAVLGSSVFLLASCTGGCLGVARMGPKLAAWTPEDGSPVSGQFEVLVNRPGQRPALDAVSISKLDEMRSGDVPYSFELPQTEGTIDLSAETGWRREYTYRVLDGSTQNYVVEYDFTIDDRFGTSRYAIRDKEIVPLYEEIMGPNIMFPAVLSGMIAFLIVWSAAAILRGLTNRRIRRLAMAKGLISD